MKESFEILPLFSTPLAMTRIEEDTDELYTYDNFESRKSTRDKRILEKYPKTKNILYNKFKEYNEKVLKYNNDFIISTSWITNIKEGQSAKGHTHKNSLYSGLYYFQDNYPEGSAPIVFFSPIAQLSDYMIIPDEVDCEILNSHTWFINPQPKLLLFFPSYLHHAINIQRTSQTRRSLAFNISPIGEYGVGDSTFNTSWLI
tara:strand:+ start:150 stop:752 length:603 start_codon:yes stop_codon:yes gene_type:complete